MLDKVRARRRVYARIAVPLAFAMLTGRLWYIQIVEGPQFQQQSDQNHLRVDVIAPARGIIFDRYDQQLVENAPNWVVSVVPSDLQRADAHAVLALLATYTHSSLSRLDQQVRDDKENPALPIPLLYDVPRDTALTLTEHLDALPGIHVDYQATRQYVDGPMFANVLGYVGRISQGQLDASRKSAQPYAPDDTAGQAGIEQGFEGQLRGQLGHRTVVVDVGGRTVGALGQQAATPGDSVELTLDASVQRAAYRALLTAVQQTGATEGAAVALDPRDGAVIALVSVPSFDPNLFVHGVSQAAWAQLTNDPAYPLLDHAIAAQYPPGSMLNPFLAAAALQEHTVTPVQTLACPTVLTEQGWDFRNPTGTGVGPFTLAQALASHCDTLFAALSGGATTTGLKVAGIGSDKLLTWLRNFGFDTPTGIKLPAEASGFLPDPAWYLRNQNQAWTPLDTYLVAAGAGPFAVTPLQLTVATASVANGGVIYRPELLQRLITPDGKVLQQLQPDVVRRLGLSPTVLQTVRNGLAQSVSSGSSQPVRLTPMLAAGMGAAAAPTSGGVGQAGLDAWWSGFAPLNDPQLVVTVLVAGGSAPDAAMPVAKAMFDAYFKPTRAEAVANAG
ncbi:MAG TPA: penicillin-binding protein 2 [Chloroflexota bacterium]|nr:penicillin-binding protein 2 [Chloroflexota bacterium]